MFDFDMFLPPSMLGQQGSAVGGGGIGKLTPISSDELTHSLSPPSNDLAAFSCPSNATCWSPKAEHHLTDDLDHIMQILVGL